MKKAPRDRGAFPCCFGRLALEGYTKMSQANATASRLDRGAESLRERIARYLAGDEAESNWSVVIGDAAIAATEEHEPCPACSGNGFVVLTEPRLKEYAQRIAHLGDEAMLARKSGDMETDRRLSTKIRDEHWKLNRESVCRTCRGSRFAAPKESSTTPLVEPDPMFTTVSCPRCMGSDRRNHPKLMDKHPGSSCGKGCPDCKRDGDVDGTGYLTPITARPLGKGGSPGAYAEELEDVPIYHRTDDRHHAGGTPEAVLSEAMKESPKLAAALIAYVGVHGDAWGKHRRGRRFSIWPFVKAGERLAAEAQTPSIDAVWYVQQIKTIEAECLAEESSAHGDPRRRMLIKRADQEARWIERRIDQLLQKYEAA